MKTNIKDFTEEKENIKRVKEIVKRQDTDMKKKIIIQKIKECYCSGVRSTN